MDSPDISFVMPAYNAERWIADAIASIRRQEGVRWELIVVDDASTDRTPDIVGSLALSDPRIRLLRRDTPSGSAYLPRKMAVAEARSPIVAPLDADDLLSDDYLPTLLSLRETTGAPLVYPSMYFFDGEKSTLHIPSDPELLGKPIPAKELLPLTFCGWRINCNGGLIPKDLFLASCQEAEGYLPVDSSQPLPANFDEFLTRVIILKAGKAALSPAPYLYRRNPDSITRRPSLRLTDYLITDRLICRWAADHPEAGTETLRQAARQRFFGTFDALRLLDSHPWPPEERTEIMRRIKESRVEPDFIPAGVSRKYSLAAKLPIPAAHLLVRLDSRLKESPRITRARWRFGNLRESLSLLRGRPLPGSEDEAFLRKFYSTGDAPLPDKKSTPLPQGSVIFMADGRMYHGGLTDRLRGLLSTYEIARRTGRPFFIHWDSPFLLEDFLQPASFDWRMAPEALSYDSRRAFPLIIQDQTPLNNRLRNRASMKIVREQLHVYSNADTSRGHFRELYNELFTPSPALKENIDLRRSEIGAPYWSVSLRFVRLLGDFQDWIGEPLPQAEAEALMSRLADKIGEILSILPEGHRLLMASDSQRFLDYAAGIDPRIYIAPGEIKHIDLAQGPHSGAWMKTFVDQHLLMGAERLYLLRTGGMYSSGFPRFAAEVGGGKFIDVSF